MIGSSWRECCITTALDIWCQGDSADPRRPWWSLSNLGVVLSIATNQELQSTRAGWTGIDKGGEGDCGYRALCCGEGKDFSDSDIAGKAGVLRSELFGHIHKRYARCANFLIILPWTSHPSGLVGPGQGSGAKVSKRLGRPGQLEDFDIYFPSLPVFHGLQDRSRWGWLRALDLHHHPHQWWVGCDNLRPLNLTNVLFWFRNSTLSIDHHFFHEGFGGFDAFFCQTAFPGEPGRKLAMETSSSSVACPWLSLPTCADSWSSP